MGNLKEINEALLSRKFSEAEQLCVAAIAKQPEFYWYKLKLAEALYSQGKRDCARLMLLQQRGRCKSIVDKMISFFDPEFDVGHVAGLFNDYPDVTGRRQYQGGVRLRRKEKAKSDKPLITIVTALYENRDTLQRCIESVRNQSYDHIEHIIVDGGSSNETLDILKRYESELEYVISEPDKGIYHAMNKGIQLAKGDFICLLNSDDYYESSFVQQLLSKREETEAEIVYCDYYHGGQLHSAQKVNDGVYLGHLNICHNTFLASKEAYNKVGLYEESYRIVSDAVWIRSAYAQNVSFAVLNQPLFTLTEGGASSGQTDDQRQLFIREVCESYIESFPFLEYKDAEEVYLLRFNKKRITNVVQIAEKYSDETFRSALSKYVEYCFYERPNFVLAQSESNGLFRDYIKIADFLGISYSKIKLTTKAGCFSDILKGIDVQSMRREPDQVPILHYASVFSRPSETFIYDLLLRLESTGKYVNYFLHDHLLLGEERPYKNRIHLKWDDFSAPVREAIYKYLFHVINPALVICHFALNEYKLRMRTEPLGITYPTLAMCHGIDVFNLKIDKEYRDYLLNRFSYFHDTHFTAVSDYLKREMLSLGIPEAKVSVVPNTVNERFFKHRKSDDYYSSGRELRILTIGRLIEWKGHRFLLEALSELKRISDVEFKFTLVYGGSDQDVSGIESLVESLGLEREVVLVPFVDFQVHPDFLSKFDLYIHPSTYTNDHLKKSETFGVAVLEAIAAGLPVLVSDAGGLPEVVGKGCAHARVFRSGSSESILTELLWVLENRDCVFTDNREFAEDRLAEFSETKQIDSVNEIINNLTSNSLSVGIFSSSTIQGAGYAAYRVHRGLLESGVDSSMYTTVRNHENEVGVKVLRHPSKNNKNWSLFQEPSNSKPGLTIFSFNQPNVTSSEIIETARKHDLVSIHWCARFLSVENIASLTNSEIPVVLTIRDMNPISGGCHYFHGCEKWKKNCQGCPQLYDTHEDFPSKVLSAKRNYYNFDNLTLVVLSNHTKNIVEQSPYFSSCNIKVIPNSIETDVFRPYNKSWSRKELGLPLDRKIIGYAPSFSSEVKGYNEAIKAFEIIKGANNDSKLPYVMLIGNRTPANDEISLDNKSLGYISDNDKLAMAYSAADVFIVPSLEETFSNTTAEALSCGVPVVGFRTGAIPDLVIDGVNGFTFEVGDFVGLAEGIKSCLRGSFDRDVIRQAAENMLSFELQAQSYQKLFSELVKDKMPFSNLSETRGTIECCDELFPFYHDKWWV